MKNKLFLKEQTNVIFIVFKISINQTLKTVKLIKPYAYIIYNI